jgi:heme exporter protein D
MMDPHERQPNAVSNYIWIVLVAVIVLLVILSIVGGRTFLKKRDARRKRHAEAKAANDAIFNPIIRAPLTAPAPSQPGKPVHKRSLAI